MKTKGNLFNPSFLIVVLFFFTVGCRHEPWHFTNTKPTDTVIIPPIDTTIACHPDTVYFQNQILPLLQSGCAVSGCHVGGNPPKGVLFTDYQTIINTADVRPGNPDGSDLFEVISETNLNKRMPPPPRLAFTNEQQELVRKWILQGAQNNSCDGCDTLAVKFSAQITNLLKNYCYNCHSGITPTGGFVLTSHTDVVNAVQYRNLLENLKYAPGFKAMPPGAQLPICEIRKVEIWINNGMLNN